MFRLFNIVFVLLFFVNGFSQTSEVYEGETINVRDAANKKQGKWIIFDKAGKKTDEGNFKVNKKEGLWKGYYPSGKIKHEITFVNNRPNGPAKFFYEDGVISEEGIWKINKWVGDYKYYHENGNMAYEWEYNESGKRTGEQKYYYDDGSLMIKGDWISGKKEGTLKEFYPDGSVKSEMTFAEGKLNVATIKEYEVAEKPATKQVAPKTQPVTKKTSEDQKYGVFSRTGFYKTYNEHKKIDREGDFVNGKLFNGKRYFYDDDGNLTRTLIYKDGKVAESIDNNVE